MRVRAVCVCECVWWWWVAGGRHQTSDQLSCSPDSLPALACRSLPAARSHQALRPWRADQGDWAGDPGGRRGRPPQVRPGQGVCGARRGHGLPLVAARGAPQVGLDGPLPLPPVGLCAPPPCSCCCRTFVRKAPVLKNLPLLLLLPLPPIPPAPPPPPRRNNEPGVLREGMTFTIEPMFTLGRPAERYWADGWTAVTADGSLAAQWEHTLLVTPGGVDVLTQYE